MITLITGLPGSGKTTYLMSEALKIKDRIVAFSGINLTAKGKALGFLEVQTWNEAPDGAVVVVDEAQRVFRPTQVGKQIPKEIAELETHRHRGIDIILVTQHPMLIHSNVRALVGRHIHIRRDKYGRVFEYEWSEIADIKSKTALAAGNAKPYKLDRSAHDYYVSTVQVQDERHRFSKKLLYAKILVGLMVVSVPFVAYGVWQGLVKKPVEVDVVGTVSDDVVKMPEPPKLAEKTKTPEEQIAELKQKEMMMLSGGHEAAVYSEAKLTGVNDFPRIAGCVKMSDSCHCYTQKAEVVDVSRKQCSEYVKNGVPLTPQMYSATADIQPRVEGGSR